MQPFNMNLKTLAVAVLIPAFVTTHAQTYLVNNDCHIVVSAGSQIHIDGSFINQNNGWVNNGDTITVTGNWTNNAANAVFVNPAAGTVVLDGAAQTIGGSGQTWFNNLVATGSGNKQLGVNTRAKGIVALNDKSIHLTNYQLYVDNTAPAAITFNGGYVNTTSGGWLVRAVNDASDYVFPVGSTTKYRPVDLTPGIAVDDTFKVRFFDHSPTLDGYDVNQTEIGICDVNTLFYHHIAKGAGSLVNADVTMYFDNTIDGNFDAIARWNLVPEWQNTSVPAINNLPSPALSTISISGWHSFDPYPFALARTAPDASIQAVAPVCTSTTPFNLTSVTPGGTWSGSGITDPVNGTFSPAVADTGSHSIYYSVTTGLGCTSMDSTVITVLTGPGDPVTPHGPATICQGTASSLYSSGAQGADSYIWTLDPPSAGTVIGSTSSAIVYWDPGFSGPVIVSVYAVNACGNSNPSSVNVTIHPEPTAAFTYTLNGVTVDFTNNSQSATSYSWDFGDGVTDFTAEPTHTYFANGDYVVQLIATNLCGNDTIYDTIQILTVGIAEAQGFYATVYPNPFAQNTYLEYALPEASKVRIALFDITGRLLEVFTETHAQPAGEYRVDISHAQFAEARGIYLLRLSVNGKDSIFKLIRL